MILSKDQQERAEEELNVDGSRHKRATLSIIKESSYQSINLLIDWSSYLQLEREFFFNEKLTLWTLPWIDQNLTFL